MLALSEFVAMETAYLALQPLSPAARSRALHWLTDALNVSDLLPQAPRAAEPAQATEVPSGTAGGADRPSGRRGRATNLSGRGAKASISDGERAYRRMPPAEDVLAAYAQVGSVSGLADFFQVPRHTVQGWARRLRREGYDIGRSA